MGTVQRPNCLILLVILGLSAVLAACSSGGGKGSSSQNNRDTIPDNFTLTTPSGVDPTKADFGTAVVSAPVKITGINAPAPVSIQGGEFKIDNGAFSSSAGTISNGQSIQVRVQTPIKAEQTATAILTIGGVEASFTVTTGPDTTPPEVSILFPPPASMTEGQTLFVRGTVKDVHGALEDGAITVNGVEAELELNEAKDEGTWSVTVDLQPGENVVEVTAIDVAKNAIEEDKPSVRSRRVESIVGESFPDDEEPFSSLSGIAISTREDNQVAFVVASFGGPIVEVDITTGNRRIFSSNDMQATPPFIRPMYLAEGEDNVLYVGDRRERQVYALDVATGERNLLNLEVIEEFEASGDLTCLAYDKDMELLYVAKGSYIFSINPVDGKMAVLAQMPDAAINSLEGLVIDSTRKAVLVTNRSPRTIASLSLRTGSVELLNVGQFSTNPSFGPIKIVEPSKVYVANRLGNIIYYDDIYGEQTSPVILGGQHGENQIKMPWDLDVMPNKQYLLVADSDLKAVVAIDVISGRRVILSKSIAN
jgi:hypothetical protein